jgi:hypothetical protein
MIAKTSSIHQEIAIAFNRVSETPLIQFVKVLYSIGGPKNKKVFQLRAEKCICTKPMEIQMIRFERTRKLKKSAQDFPPIKK